MRIEDERVAEIIAREINFYRDNIKGLESDKAEQRVKLYIELKQRWPKIVQSYTMLSYSIYIHCLVDHYRDMVPIFRWLAKQGVTQMHDKPQDTGYSLSYSMTDDIALIVYFTGSNCKYVKVGERTEPVYELRCDNGD